MIQELVCQAGQGVSACVLQLRRAGTRPRAPVRAAVRRSRSNAGWKRRRVPIVDPSRVGTSQRMAQVATIG